MLRTIKNKIRRIFRIVQIKMNFNVIIINKLTGYIWIQKNLQLRNRGTNQRACRIFLNRRMADIFFSIILIRFGIDLINWLLLVINETIY